MSKSLIEEFAKSLQTGFIDKTSISEVLYQPELLVNRKRPPKKVLTTILQELNNCDGFFISVAFVTTGGVATLINSLKFLEAKGIKGKILVSQYLNFTQPEALRKLLKLKNIKLRISVKENSHSKGYLFKTSDYYNLIIGSSNLTAQALSTNKEWNLKVSGLNSSSIVEKILGEFESDFDQAIDVTPDFIAKYAIIYQKQLLFYQQAKRDELEEGDSQISPNSMQIEALKNLVTLRAAQKNKALLISATGTGKTYLSAFDAKVFKPQRLLFVVHRLNIAKKSMESFKKIFRDEKTMGLYSGNIRELDNDFIFCTVQTISKQAHLNQFKKDHFDYIIIDETHRAGADSYQRLVDYFEPRFLLGMTATPERTDGNDIFSLFDHNIAYEIRLNRAMEEDMLSQFHYYGVTDLIVDDTVLENARDFKFLTAKERVDRIISSADFYGCDNGITRGLVFCSRNEEAKKLSNMFNQKGYKTIALSGENSEQERVDAIDKLESDDLQNKLDYIFTVDIFNEGVDIPRINQILMIRPTDSAIIFIQQLGRGLRKTEGKGYLTIVDFIGNYKNNYLIPIALYGDTSYNKDSLRRLLSEGSRMIPGASTINFDEITKERIFQSIDSANMQLLADLRNDYNLLKYKLGRTPMMMDFPEHGSRDPFLYVDYANSYLNFVIKVDKDLTQNISEKSIKLLELFSKEINNSKRVEESIILKELIENNTFSTNKLTSYLHENYGYSITEETIISCVANINFEFIREKKDGKLLPVKDIYNLEVISYKNGYFMFVDDFKQLLEQSQFKAYLLDSIKYSIYRFNQNFDLDKWDDGFVLYQKYARKDVFRILNVKENPVAQNVGGYLVSPDNKHCPIFVNYHKEEDISESTKYEDEFVNNKEFDWMSKSKRTIESNDVKSILGNNGKIRLPLFIKKSNDEGLEFYYMGGVSPEKDKVAQTTMNNDKGQKISVVKFRFNLHHPVSEVMYNYLQENGTPSIKKNPIIKEPVNQFEIELTNNNNANIKRIPFYDFYAAAGSFSEMQSEKDFSLIEVPENYASSDYFACKIIGESMNKVIPNGSICLFKIYIGGSRNGKIVLVENFDYQDPDFNSAFTVKTYSSEKNIDEDSWEHTSIVLRPNSHDQSYKNIIIDEKSGAEMRVVGEFIKVLPTVFG
jgi:superfamily II DNA or RNA helicase/HKD family nuclease/SOS-response transcriptional repressor LexA